MTPQTSYIIYYMTLVCLEVFSDTLFGKTTKKLNFFKILKQVKFLRPTKPDLHDIRN